MNALGSPPPDLACDTCDLAPCAAWCDRRDAERFEAAVRERTAELRGELADLQRLAAEVVLAWDADPTAMRMFEALTRLRCGLGARVLREASVADPVAGWGDGR